MGRPTGFEPATPRSTILCSNQLSYDRRKEVHALKLALRCQVGLSRTNSSGGQRDWVALEGPVAGATALQAPSPKSLPFGRPFRVKVRWPVGVDSAKLFALYLEHE